MKRSTLIATRVAASAISLLVGVACALVRLVMGHEFYTCLAAAIIACWAIFPSPEDLKALSDAQRADKGKE